MIRFFPAIILALAFLLSPSEAHAGNGEPADKTAASIVNCLDRQSARFRHVIVADVCSFDAVGAATVAAATSAFQVARLGPQDATARGTFLLSARFNTAGATATVDVVHVYYDPDKNTWTELGHVEYTLTADPVSSQDELFEAPRAPFDTGGGNFIYVFVRSISAGTVDLWEGSE